MQGIPAGLKPAEVAEWFTNNIHTPGQFKALPVWKTAFRQMGSFLATHSTPILKVFAGIVKFLAMKEMSTKLKKSMTHKVEDTRWRFYASIGAFAGEVFGTAGKVLRYVPKFLKMGQGLSALAAARGAELAGEITAGVAGLVVAAMDLRNAEIEWRQGHRGIWLLYLSSFAVGGASSVLFFLGFIASLKATAAAAAGTSAVGTALTGTALTLTGWGIAFAIAGMVIGAIIAAEKSNPVQDWMKRCIFHGELKSGEKTIDCYSNMFVEIENLNKALVG